MKKKTKTTIKTARATVTISPDGKTLEIRLNKAQRDILEESAGNCGEDFRATFMDYFGVSMQALFSAPGRPGPDILQSYQTNETYRFDRGNNNGETSALVALIWTGKAKFVKI